MSCRPIVLLGMCTQMGTVVHMVTQTSYRLAVSDLGFVRWHWIQHTQNLTWEHFHTDSLEELVWLFVVSLQRMFLGSLLNVLDFVFFPDPVLESYQYWQNSSILRKYS